MTLIQFSQNLMQGGWMNKDAYSQLPYMGEKEIKIVKSLINNKTVCKYAELSAEERKEMAPKIWGDDWT